MSGEDLQRERYAASLSASEIESITCCVIDDDITGKRTQLRRQLVQLASSEPVFQPLISPAFHSLSRVDKFKAGVRMCQRLAEMSTQIMNGRLRDLNGTEIDLNYVDPIQVRLLLRSALQTTLPTDLHDGVCVGFVLSQFNDDQQMEFLPPMLSYNHLYAYAQTELGHGSNVQGIETTATYLADTDEFEVHSPELTATKWWPGNMGRMATHVICMAQLIVGDKRHGVTPFIVPIRDPATRACLPGVDAGDIGATGYELVDNGFCRFTRVRIPRTNMAMRHSTVERGDIFVSPDHPKLSFGGMVAVRAMIVSGAAAALGAAVTIAVRYSAQRRQFRAAATDSNTSRASLGELPVLDYAMQQYRLLPLLATTYALRFIGRAMTEMHADLQTRLEHGDISALAEVHATSSGLKSLCTQLAGDGIEAARKCCGGHGYMRAAGFWALFENYIGVQTAEGENYLLTQQTSRYLLKTLHLWETNAVVPSGSSYYLAHGHEKSAEDCSRSCIDLGWQLAVLEWRSRDLVKRTASKIRSLTSDGVSAVEAQNRCQIEFAKMSRAHCLAVMAKSFQEGVARRESMIKNGSAAVLRDVCRLFSLYYIEQELGDFLGGISVERATELRECLQDLLRCVRVNAVVLVDALDLHDFQLRSVLGKFNGNAYEELFTSAIVDPANSDHERAQAAKVVSEMKSHSRL